MTYFSLGRLVLNLEVLKKKVEIIVDQILRKQETKLRVVELLMKKEIIQKEQNSKVKLSANTLKKLDKKLRLKRQILNQKSLQLLQ